MSKESKERQRAEFAQKQESFRKEYNENHSKVLKSGIKIGSKTGADGKYFTHEGSAYDSHEEAVKDIVKQKGL